MFYEKRLLVKISSLSLYLANDDPWHHDAGVAPGFVLHPPPLSHGVLLRACFTNLCFNTCFHYFSHFHQGCRRRPPDLCNQMTNMQSIKHEALSCFVRIVRSVQRKGTRPALGSVPISDKDFVSSMFVMTRIVKDREGNNIA